MGFSDPAVATLISEAFIPVQVSMLLNNAYDDPEGRQIVSAHPRLDGRTMAAPDLLVFSPELALLGQLSFMATAAETLLFLQDILTARPDLAPAVDPLQAYAYDLNNPAQAALAALEARWESGERATLAAPLQTWLAAYGDGWAHGAATALTLLGAAHYHQGEFAAADAAWQRVVAAYPNHPLAHRAAYNLLDPVAWVLPPHPDIAAAAPPEPGIDRPIVIPNEAVRAENIRRVLFDPHYTISRSGLPLVRIPAGTFTMGGQPAAFFPRERPLRRVTISRPFLMAAWPITRGLWRRFRPDDVPESESALADEIPMQTISHEDAQAFCDYLSALDGIRYRLPTEAEWEYAARGGLEGMPHPWGDDPVSETRCNYRYSQGVPVASYPANGYGLFEMVGNVLEWTADRYLENAYELTPYDVTDPCVTADMVPADHFPTHVARGGAPGLEFSKMIMRNAIRLIQHKAGLRLIAELSE